MLGLSTARTATRAWQLTCRNRSQVSVVRRSSDVAWRYRLPYQPTSNQFLGANVLMTAAWYWILWHMWYDWGTFAGHHAYPDPSEWSDAELGIPGDNDD